MSESTASVKLFLPVAVLALFIVFWRATTDPDVAVAQGRTTVVVTRIFTGPEGLAHAEDIELSLTSRGATEMLLATGAEFSVRAPTPGANPNSKAATLSSDPAWHTGPARQLVITLSGSSEVEVSGGVQRTGRPRTYQFNRRYEGKGHIARNFGPDDRVALTIPLADGVVFDGKRTLRTR